MAMNNNRNYIGIEISEEYCKIIEKRLSPLKTFIEKSQLDRMLEEKKKRSLLFPQKEFPTL